jgi:hypothetical protein
MLSLQRSGVSPHFFTLTGSKMIILLCVTDRVALRDLHKSINSRALLHAGLHFVPVRKENHVHRVSKFSCAPV